MGGDVKRKIKKNAGLRLLSKVEAVCIVEGSFVRMPGYWQSGWVSVYVQPHS